MMPPGHVAVTLGVATLHPTYKLDYRLLVVAALLPDLIDKPLALFVFTASDSAQNISHALLPNLVIFLAALLWRPGWLPYVLAFNAHLLLDRMWHHTETFWWPIFGWTTFWAFKPMNTPETMLAVYLDILTRYPQVWVIEFLALVYLTWFVIRHKLYSLAVMKKLIFSGQLT